MSDPFAIAASGLAAQSQRIAVSADAVANASTRGFVPGRVVTQEQRGGGVTTVVTPPSHTPATDPAVESQIDQTTVALSQTDLVQELTTQRAAAALYRANLASLRTADETTRTLLDLHA